MAISAFTSFFFKVWFQILPWIRWLISQNSIFLLFCDNIGIRNNLLLSRLNRRTLAQFYRKETSVFSCLSCIKKVIVITLRLSIWLLTHNSSKGLFVVKQQTSFVYKAKFNIALNWGWVDETPCDWSSTEFVALDQSGREKNHRLNTSIIWQAKI